MAHCDGVCSTERRTRRRMRETTVDGMNGDVIAAECMDDYVCVS